MYQCFNVVSRILWRYIDIAIRMCYLKFMKAARKNYNTTLRIDLIKKLKMLAVQEDIRVNDLLEEAIEIILKKYEKKAK